jgi:hypothetical protein
LSEALGHLDRWHAARGSPDRCAAPERAAADECSQELWILLSGAWSDAFPEDDTLEFLEKLREHPRTRPCTTVISPPGARLHEGVCQMREAGHIRVEEVEAECLEATPPAMGAAEPFGYSCGEAVTPAQCNAEVCQAFWPLVGEDSPRRFKRIDLLGGGQVARGTDRTETGSPLDCGRTDQLVEVKPKSPHHPVHHVLLLDITVSMAPYWDAKDRQRTYDRLLRGISRFMLPQDRLTVYRLGLHLEEVLDHGVGVDPTAYVVSLDRPADNEAGASSILRALKVAASTGGQGILLPRPVDTSRDAPKFRAGVHTVIWVFSDGEESFDKRLDLKAPGRGPTDAWRTASIKRLSEAGEMARLESTLARTPWVGGRLPAVVVLPLSADPGPAAEPKPISPADLIRVFPVAVAFAGTTLEGVFRWYLHQ